jgi:hypothetical protein
MIIKKILLLSALLLLLVSSAVLLIQSDYVTKLAQQVLNSSSQANPLLGLLQHNLVLPDPLRGAIDRPGGQLTITGILQETNRHRGLDQLPALDINQELNQAAASKLEDMFVQQYFDHVSPDGVTPSEIVTHTGYQHLRVGENLALGNYSNDAELVQAWMDSPGHRANILSHGFSEIGIAVGAGQFEGHTTWLAVQTFALPASSCPQPVASYQQTFTSQQTALTELSQQLSNDKDGLQARQDRIDELLAEIQRLSDTGHNKITRGNQIMETLNRLNTSDRSPNTASPHTQATRLQQDGQTLLQQASDTQNIVDQLYQQQTEQLAAYNAQVDKYNQLNQKLSDLADQLNEQIQAYNNCANEYLD